MDASLHDDLARLRQADLLAGARRARRAALVRCASLVPNRLVRALRLERLVAPCPCPS